MEYLFLAVLWIIWCAIHSGMISLTATDFAKRWLGPHYRFYRLGFNLLATATIIPVILYGHLLDGHIVFRWDGFLIGVRWLLLAVSGLLFIAGARHYDMFQLLGIRQIATGVFHNALTESGKLNNYGILNRLFRTSGCDFLRLSEAGQIARACRGSDKGHGEAARPSVAERLFDSTA